MTERLRKLIEMSEKSETDFLLFAMANEHEANSDLINAQKCYEKLLANYAEYIATYYHYAVLLQQINEPIKANTIIETGIQYCQKVGDRHSESELRSLLYNDDLD